MEAGHQRGEVVPRARREHDFAVDNERVLGESLESVDELGEIPAERPMVAAADVNVASLSEDESTEAVPLWFEEPCVTLRQGSRQPSEHRFRRAVERQHALPLPTHRGTMPTDATRADWDRSAGDARSSSPARRSDRQCLASADVVHLAR